MTRRASLTGISTCTPGRSEGTQTYPHAANVIRFPSVSLPRPIAPLEISNPLQTGLDIGVAMFWISYFLLWFFGLGFASWALLRAIHLL
jgi:hypothetical protein